MSSQLDPPARSVEKTFKVAVKSKSAVVLGVTADIGRAITTRLLADGWYVCGLGRSSERLEAFLHDEKFSFIACDLSDARSVRAAIDTYRSLASTWTLFVSCAGTMEPIGKFFELDFDAWEKSIVINMTSQLRCLHGLWPSRETASPIDVMFMAGGGTNSPLTSYSAYCVSKIALIKMCELIDDEEPNANAFIIGPGFVHTRIHSETLKAGKNAGVGYDKTLAFLETPGTSFDDIYAHMRWCMNAGRTTSGGRNFSTVHDAWRNGGQDLIEKLAGDPNALRLRRQQP